MVLKNLKSLLKNTLYTCKQPLMMAYERSESIWDNFGKFINQFKPKTKTLIKKCERILIKIYIQYIYIYIFHHTTCESTCDTLPSSAANQEWQHSFGSSRQYCHSWCYQAAFATGQGIKRIVYIYIYIYMADQLRAETTLDVHLHF